MSRRHRSRWLIRDVSFDAGAGRTFAILGANGAGKTTVFRQVLGLSRGSGRATFAGRTYRELRNPRLVVGATLGPLRPTRGTTLIGHFSLVAVGIGVGRTRVDAVVEEFGLTDVVKEQMDALPDGVLQRAALATADMGKPRFLVLDEPTRSLDQGSLAWFCDWIRQREEQGACIVMSSHDLSTTATVAHDLGIMVDGHMVAWGSMDDLATRLGVDDDVVVEWPTPRAAVRLSAVYRAAAGR